MREKASIPRYVKLSSDDYLGIDSARSWYKVVLANSPEGIVSEIDSIDRHGNIKKTRLVRRSVGEKTSLIVPLIRDLLPAELEKIADAWKAVAPSGSFTISTNPTQDQKLNQAVNGLELENSEYQNLCLQLAKARHESWMREKTQDGWSYGLKLSLKNKTHPLLRPWDELPEQYRDVDTNNPENFLNLIYNQGFAVVRQSELQSLLKILRDLN